MLQANEDDHHKPACPYHGQHLKRGVCKHCRAAYMREYQRRRRRANPATDLLRRAKERAARSGIEFSLIDAPVVPKRCPALGLPLTPGGRRRDTSPALDRIDPIKGYVVGNVRVICDRANRLKGNHSLEHVRALANTGPVGRQREFGLIARYQEREALLRDVVRRSKNGPGDKSQWAMVSEFLERAYARGDAFRDDA